MSEDVLLEVGCEEIPAGYIPPALEQIKSISKEILGKMRITFGSVEAYATPRRLVLYIQDISDKQDDVTIEVTGPPKSVALDKEGNFTKAALGFAQSQNVNVDDLITRQTPRGEYITAVKTEAGKPTKNILPAILSQVISSLRFPKSMRWNNPDVYFARPIRWLLAMWGDKIIRFSYAGLKSQNKTYGHPTLSPKKLVITHVRDYFKILKINYVIVKQDERLKLIQKQLDKGAEEIKGHLLVDEELLEIVNYLVEYPTAICGSFSQEFLSLPRDVLIAVMKKHQKYFSVIDGKNKLLPFFIVVRNGTSRFMKPVKEGNQRVMHARLSDAQFFYKQDIKEPLRDKAVKLKDVVFHQRLGTLYDKSSRIMHLSDYICTQIQKTLNTEDIRDIALLCKVDLITEMVYEFPELQGIIGCEYAKLTGENSTVANGIYEHYMPVSSDSALPKSVEGAIVSIADKIDTITGNFSLGLIPTGSGDPYGLRRYAIGIIRIIIDKKLQIPLDRLIDKSLQLVLRTDSSMEDVELIKIKQNILEFFKERAETVLTQKALKYDEINAALAAGFSDIVDLLARAKAVHSVRKLPDFEPIIAAFKRARNILIHAREKDVLNDTVLFRGDLLKEKQESELYEMFKEIEQDIIRLLKDREYKQALIRLVDFRDVIDRFFDKIMVMDENTDLRNNRLALLRNITDLFLRIADFSRIVKEG